MKLNLIYAFAIAGAMAAFSSCSNNDEPTMPGSSLEQKTYSGTDALTLNYNGSPLVGKTVTFTPGTGDNATLTLAGEALDVTQIMGMMTRESENPSLALPTAGVLPGSPSLSIPVKLQGDPDNCTFEGSGETDYCTYSYSGSVTEDACEFNLTDVKLKNTSLAGTWTVPALDNNFYNVGRVNWESPVIIDAFIPMKINILVSFALSIPLISYDDEVISPSEMLTKALQSVTFSEDGTLTAKYLDTQTGEIVEAPTGIAQYVITSEGNIRLFLNPAAIITNTLKVAQRSTRAIDIQRLVEDLLTQLTPMLAGGIPISYGQAIADSEGNINEDSNVKSFYLGTETLLPLLKALAPIFTDEDFVNSLVEEAAKDPNMGMMAGMLPQILNALPEVIEKTTKVEIGINLQK